MAKKTSSDRVPTHLSPEAKALWAGIQDEFKITDAAGRRLLLNACEASDLMRSAEKILAVDGLTSEDKSGVKRAHPMLAVVRDSRSAMLASLKSLNLDLEPLRDGPGRPIS